MAMLKHVDLADIELGMFIHKLEGSWFKHPFWKSKFLLDDAETLDTLRASDIEGVIIDISKGKDVPSVSPPPKVSTPAMAVAPRTQRVFGRAREVPAQPATAPVPAWRPPARPAAPLGIAREFGSASKAVGRANKVINRVFLEARLGKGVRTADVEPVVEDIYASVQRNVYAFSGLLRCRQDSEYVYRHSLAVSALMVALARTMKLPPHDMRDAGMAGLLMDIGVGQLPIDLSGVGGDYRQLKPEIRNQHVLLGYSLLKAAGDIPETVLRVIMRHHEKLDGSGYPQGLSGSDIDVLSRMAAVCDCFDNLVSGSGDEPALDPAEALRRVCERSGEFDAEIVQRFIECVGVYPIGSFVRLRSDRLAMVVDEDASDSAHPVVRTFWSLAQGKRAKPETIRLADCYGEDAIEGVADLDGLDLPPLDKLRQTLLTSAVNQG